MRGVDGDRVASEVRLDPESVRIGTTRSLGRVGMQEPDANEDGAEDIELRFSIDETGLPCDATSASLEGMTIDGQRIWGFAPIRPRGY